MKRITTIGVATVASLGLVFPALGQQDQQGTSQQEQHSKQKHSQQAQKQGQRSQDRALRDVKGELLEVRSVALKGEEEKHVLAKVRQQNGRTAIIDLGPMNNLQAKNVKIVAGTKVEASGKTGRINGLPILIVDRYVGDGQVTILAPIPSSSERSSQKSGTDHAASSSQSSGSSKSRQAGSSDEGAQGTMGYAQPPQQGQTGSQRQSPESNALYFGQLTDLRDVKLKGIPDNHRLGKLHLRNGQTVIIDLGTKDALGDVKLEKGEMIAVTGSMGQISGKQVIFADTVADVARVNRGGDAQAQQQSN